MSDTQSKTPRSDAQNCGWWNHPSLPSFSAVNIDFARELERENAALRKALEMVRKGCLQIVELANINKATKDIIGGVGEAARARLAQIGGGE